MRRLVLLASATAVGALHPQHTRRGRTTMLIPTVYPPAVAVQLEEGEMARRVPCDLGAIRGLLSPPIVHEDRRITGAARWLQRSTTRRCELEPLCASAVPLRLNPLYVHIALPYSMCLLIGIPVALPTCTLFDYPRPRRS